MAASRTEAIRLYKNLLYLGRDYPAGYEYFRSRLKAVFMKNRDVTDPDKLKTLISHGEFVSEEIKALYMLKKYRTLKSRYYANDPPESERMKIIEELSRKCA